MERSVMHIGQKVKLPAREIVTWEGGEYNLRKKESTTSKRKDHVCQGIA